jgi:hypothetical protein
MTAIITAHRQLNAAACGDMFRCAWHASRLANVTPFFPNTSDVRLPLFVYDRLSFNVKNVRGADWLYFPLLLWECHPLCRTLGHTSISNIREVYPTSITCHEGFSLEILVDENCTLMGCYAAYSGNSLPKFWDNLSVPKRRQGIPTTRRVIAQKSAVPIPSSDRRSPCNLINKAADCLSHLFQTLRHVRYFGFMLSLVQAQVTKCIKGERISGVCDVMFPLQLNCVILLLRSACCIKRSSVQAVRSVSILCCSWRGVR